MITNICIILELELRAYDSIIPVMQKKFLALAIPCCECALIDYCQA